jgi:hypothetical protein
MAVFVTGTRTFFVGEFAPTGWTKDTTNYNEYTLRVVNGSASSGGSVNFTTAFTSQTVTGTAPFSGLTAGATTLGPTTLPSHTHPVSAGPIGPNSYNYYSNMGNPAYAAPAGPVGSLVNSGATGGGGSHSHPFGSIGVSINGTVNLAVKYVDIILAIKN